jgi:CHAD domain-containing protein
MIERETKLAAPPGFRLPALDEVVEGSTAETLPVERLSAAYHDTADLRLIRAGVTLRYRKPEGWTLKLPVASENGSAVVRDEVSMAGRERSVPEQAVDLVRALTRTEPLVTVAKIRTTRRGTRLATAEGEHLATVTDDEVSVMDGARVGARFREIEVELAPELGRGRGDDVMEAVVARLRSAGAGEAVGVPKLVRALGPRAVGAPDIEVPDLGKAPTAADAVRRALAASVARLIEHDPVVRVGEDPEGVHQARVATRRLRSDLRTFASLLDPGWAGPLRDDLRSLGAVLGEVRDADVLLAELRGRVADLPEQDRRVGERLVQGLERGREAARERLLTEMRSERYLALLDRLVEAARSPRVLEEEGGEPADEVLPDLVVRPWRHLRRVVEALPDEPTDEELHEVRIRAKRTRYAAEAAAPVVGREAAAFAKAVAGLQEVLGEHQDAVVAGTWLRDAGARAGSRGAFVAGTLAGVERARAAAAREAWPRAWRRASRKRLRSWM